MKKNMNLKQNTHPLKNVLAMSVSAIMTAMTCASTATYASDIDIYQEARSGNISLMFVLDISGSMRYFDANNVEYSSCSSGAKNEAFSENGISYNRRYCELEGRIYYYLRTGSSGNRTWYSCGASGSVNQSDCTIRLAREPSTSGYLTEGSNPRYYYRGDNVISRYYDRLTLVKDAMYQLLYGSNAVGKDKYFGLTTYSINGDGTRGQVRIPVNRLGLDTETTLTSETHRKNLMLEVAGLEANGGTPTANAYAEAAAYMLGTSTLGGTTKYARYNGNWYQCNTTSPIGSCDRANNDTVNSVSSRRFGEHDCSYRGSVGAKCYYVATNGASGQYAAGTGVLNDDALTYKMPESLSSQFDEDSDTRQCSGQGIYVLTDGVPNGNSNAQSLMKGALSGSATFSCSDSDGGWDCVEKFNTRLLNQTTNASPRDLVLKTAVVGFGSAYNSIASYNKNLTEAENIALVGSGNSDEERAARWGIRGQGGWYAGTSSQDIINSVNDFINSLSTEIPAVTTGTATIPTDQLNPSVLQNFAYYPQFQPTPDKSYQLWAGNLKKYKVTESGVLVDKNDDIFVDTQGRILDNYDLWSADRATGNVNHDDENILGSDKNMLMGGVKSRLKLRDVNGVVQRKILTNRATSATDGAYLAQESLRALSLTEADGSDPAKGYLLSLLGYRVDPKRPTEITRDSLGDASELRQVGAVMHSSPLLLTNKGKIQYNSTSNSIGSDNREDYVLFGTTQGLLHVVDANTGEEKFAFLPNAMVEDQKEAFANVDTTIGGMDRLYYGVDGPWTAYTEYVLAADDILTVGNGLNGKVGKQLVYGGLRMGGRNYYALDLSDIDEPSLKFTIAPTGECSATNPLGCMGQSWSKPTITHVNWKGSKKLVMLVGGGYDAQGLPESVTSMPETTEAQRAAKQAAIKHYRGYEYDDYEQTNKIGAGVYMFDALNGELLWWTGANATGTVNNVVSTPSLDMKYSVVSQIRVVDRDSDGLSDHFYFGDLGGQVWRIDYNNAKIDNENLRIKAPTRLLNLHNGKGSPRFYDMPAFSTYTKDGAIYGVVSIGSGNRSKPLAEYSTDNTQYNYDGIYNIYDKDVSRQDLFNISGSGSTQAYASFIPRTKDVTLLSEESDLPDNGSINQLVAIDNSNRFSNQVIRAPFATTQGWYYLFKSDLVQSEKVLATPLVINNDIFVTTFDGSKDGMSGDCGAGVKGESFMTLFCMPYGQCNGGDVSSYRLNLGAGIVGGAVGAGDGSGMQRLIVANVDTTGITGNAILNKRYNTSNKLIPQRWYERR